MTPAMINCVRSAFGLKICSDLILSSLIVDYAFCFDLFAPNKGKRSIIEATIFIDIPTYDTYNYSDIQYRIFTRRMDSEKIDLYPDLAN
jgi:hypothetical protein